MHLKKKAFQTGFWVILMHGFSLILRLASNLIITRLLVPEMFGVMAIVNVVIVGVEMMSDVGIWPFVVRHKNPDDKHFLNVIWTIQVIRGWFIFLGVSLLTTLLILGQKYIPNLFVGVYADARLPYLILIAGIPSLLSGYKSMASPIMSRKLQVAKLEIIEITSQLIGVIVMIFLAWHYRSIWALVSSGVISTLVSTILGYKFFPYRHQLTWDKSIFKELFEYGKWIVISSSLTYLFMQGDKLYLAGHITAAKLGIFSVASMLAVSLCTLINVISIKVVFPILSTVAHQDNLILKDKYYKIRFYLDSVVFMVAGILIAISPLIVEVLYDDRYVDAGWMFQILAISVIGSLLTAVSLECLSALGITKVNMWVMLVRTLGLFIGLPLFFNLYGMKGAMWVIALNIVLPLPIIYRALAKSKILSLSSELKLLPLVAVGYLVGKWMNVGFRYFAS